MSSKLFIAFVLLPVLLICVCIEAQAPTYRYHFCSNTTSFTPNSSYQSNLNLLLSSLTSNATRDIGFYYTRAGVLNSTTEVVYGSFLCRGDLTPELCQECVATIAKDGVQTFCPLGKIAIIWYDECMLRYTNQSFLNRMDEAPRVSMWNIGNISDPTRFTQLLAETINGLVAPASNAPSGAKKYAKKEENFTDFQQLYSLVQCTPDLSSTSCDTCLRGAIAQLPGCCTGKQGGRVLYPSCNVRYEIYPFYTVQAATPPPAPSPPSLLLPPPPGSVTRPDQGTANFTSNSTYESNLNLLFSYLASNATNDLGFYNTTVGSQGPGMDVYGSLSCRGDVTPEKCQECVSTIARNGVPKDCASRKSVGLVPP
ncbi:PREDICTED: cysteine-rich receptor-like protein kinase 25-like [Fragaria vesca subsp. vesca]